MAKFKKKPVVVEAIEWTGENLEAVKEFLGDDFAGCPSGGVIGHGAIMFTTLAGHVTAREGDWILRGVAGEHYPCKPHIFEATFEAVVEGE